MRTVRLSQEEIAEELARASGWSRTGEAIARTYSFKSFRQAVAFVVQVADAAENADHHPDIDIRYRKVTLLLTTHDSGGLTVNDFELAAACDALAGGVRQ